MADLYIHVQSSSVFIAKKWKQPMDKWRNKQNMIYSNNEILCSPKKEGNPVTCYDMHELWRYVKQNKPVTNGKMLYNSNYMKFVEWSHSRNRKYNDSCQGLGAGEETREVWFKGYTVSILQDEKSSGDNFGSGYTTMWICLMLLNCPLKNG